MIIQWLKSWFKKPQPKPVPNPEKSVQEEQLEELQALFRKYTTKGCYSQNHCMSCRDTDEVYLSNELKRKLRENMLQSLAKVNTEMNILLKSGDDIAISEAQTIINNAVKDFKVQKLGSTLSTKDVNYIR